MKKRSIFITLLLSVAMVFGAFALTSFAEDSTDAGHDWTYNPAKSESFVGGIAFKCKNTDADHECDYNGQNHHAILMEAYDDVENGEEYFGGYVLTVYEADGEECKLPEPDEFTFGDQQYSEDGKGWTAEDKEWTDEAPSKAGAYDVRMELLVNGEKTNVFLYDSFSIYKMKVDGLKAKLTYGESVAPKVVFVDKDGEEATEFDVDKDDYYFEYKSLDSPFAKYSKKVPKTVGHYRVRATYVNGAEAEMDFEIVKNTNEDLEVGLALGLDASKYLPELKEYDITNQTLGQIIGELALMGFRSEAIKPYWPDDNDTISPVDSRPLFLFVKFAGEDGEFVSPVYYGFPAFVCKDQAGKITPFVPGVTVLKNGKYKISFSIPATRNHVAAYGSVEVIIGKDEVKIIKEPEARKNLIFNDSYQELVKPGVAEGGKFLYAVADGDLAPEDDKYSEDIPTAKDVNDYVVWWKLVAEDGYKGEAYGSVDVSIAPYEKEDDPKDETIIAPELKNVRASAKKKSFTVKWNKLSEGNLDKIDTIEVQYSKDKNFKKKVKTRIINKSKTSYKVKGLKKGRYYVRVRTVKYGAKDKDGKFYLKYASDWSKAVKVKVK